MMASVSGNTDGRPNSRCELCMCHQRVQEEISVLTFVGERVLFGVFCYIPSLIVIVYQLRRCST